MDESILLGVFVAVEGAHAFSAFMPSWFTIRKFGSEDLEDTRRLRSGYLPAVLFNFVLGGSVSAITKTMWPLILSVLVTLFMLAMYEGAIHAEDNEWLDTIQASLFRN